MTEKDFSMGKGTGIIIAIIVVIGIGIYIYGSLAPYISDVTVGLVGQDNNISGTAGLVLSLFPLICTLIVLSLIAKFGGLI